jgi:hypothetical protein
MATTIKFMNKNLNLNRLQEELQVAGVPITGMLVAGFNRVGLSQYEPFTETQVIGQATGQPDDTADPGELRFKSDAILSSTDELNLDVILSVHDNTLKSSSQANKDTDIAAIAPLVNNFQNWGTLSNAEKDNNHRQLTRLVARLLDSTQDI